MSAATLLGCLVGTTSRGQISPGELSAAHASLEGSRGCLECHAAGRGVDRSACLSCHTALRQRIDSAAGLHARSEYGACETCHIEHQGRSFELVWWGEAGIETFDHDQAGWPLEDAHRDLGCRSCHRRDRIATPEPLVALDKDLDRTFLGLGTACASCHDDPHRDQFRGTACHTCHDQRRFVPASGFDHEGVFPLDGRHLELSCDRCHPALPGPRPESASESRRVDLLFRDLGRTACRDCHSDPHEDRLGGDCASCHDTESWARAGRAGFDHRKTAFDLAGRHLQVRCESCHGPSFDRPRPASGTCADCHADPHLGQLSRTTGSETCETCHHVGGFVPSTFTVADHATSTFPLEGRHREQACDACHTMTSPREIADLRTAHAPPESIDPDAPVRRFRFPATECHDCHDDPHLGTAARAGQTLCTECHDLAGWTSVAFAHRRTGTPLEGGHRGVGCLECHRPPPADAATGLRFDGLSTACADCHRDPHAGQFATAPPPSAGSVAVVRCERCHADALFRPVHFDHQLDSRFPLEGAHLRVACAACHPRDGSDGTGIVRYRPLGRDCSDCHASPPPAIDGVGS